MAQRTVGSLFTESVGTTPVLANAVITGDAQDMAPGGTFHYDRFRAGASSNVAGTLTVEASPDKTSWYAVTTDITGTVAASATAMVIVETKVTMRYMRAKLTNGGTNQTNVRLTTAGFMSRA